MLVSPVKLRSNKSREMPAMTFERWLITKGNTQSTADKYGGALSGSLSDWAIAAGIVSNELTSIDSKSQFDSIAIKIRALSIYQERNSRGHNMYGSALNKFSDYLAEHTGLDAEAQIASIVSNPNLEITEKSNLVKSRIGQGLFRQNLIQYWGGCAVTGFKDVSLLVASHIKPWRHSDNKERLDTFNGLLLTPNHDKAFDAGLITFESDGRIRISPQLLQPASLGISPEQSIALAAGHASYMDYHRTAVYRSS